MNQKRVFKTYESIATSLRACATCQYLDKELQSPLFLYVRNTRQSNKRLVNLRHLLHKCVPADSL